jgi:MFS family permease
VAAAVWAKELNWTPSTIDMMLSASSLGYLVMQPLGGWIADHAGPRRTLAGAMAGWSFWVLLTPIAPTVLWLTAIFRMLLGAFEAPYIPATAAAVARPSPPMRSAEGLLHSCSRARSSGPQLAYSSRHSS